MTTPYRPDNPFAGNGRYRSDNPFAAEPPPSVMGSVALPTVGKAARDATVAPFRNLDESGAAYDALQRTNIQDAKGVAATALQGATFNLADDVLPIKGSVEYLKRRSPTVAAVVNLASGLAVPGLAALKAIKAIRPTTMAGQVALGSGLGAAETALATAGDTEGSLGDRIRAGLKAAPVGAGAGAVLGAVPGAITKTGNAIQAIKRKPKEAAAAARSAVRLLRGKQPDLGDAVTLGKLLGGGEARQPFTGLGQNVDIRELATRAKRMNPNVLDGMPSRDVANLVGQGTTDGPKRLAALAAKPGPDVDEVVRLGVEGSRPKLTLMNPSTSTGPRPPVAGPAVSRPMPTASLEGATAPVVEPPRSRPTVIPPDDDPLLAAMIEQTKRGKPTPKPGQAVGPKLSKADRVAAMKARSLAGDVVKESELTGLTLAERIEARGGQQAIEAAKATGDRSEYSAYLKKHGQTSEVRRGEHNDLTRDPIKMAEKEALQAQADALPDTEEGNRLRDILYQQWKKLKDEYGRIGPLYHGSPHKFDKFDLSKIGTGEGAQAYGHGLYFTETPGIARQYQRELSKAKGRLGSWTLERGGQEVAIPGYDVSPATDAELFDRNIAQAVEGLVDDGWSLEDAAPEATKRRVAERIRGWLRHKSNTADDVQEIEGTLRALDNVDIKVRQPGALYTAELPNVDPEDFLLWDKPLSQQSEKVRKAVTTALDPIRNNFPTKDTDTAAEVVRALTRESSAEQTTKTLRKAGIKGIKYLDGSSRSAGDGSYNYVVFDDADINILNREGRIGPRGPKPGFKRLYRVEPKDLGDKGAWLQKALTPEEWEKFVAERGRLFSDNLESIKNYGAGQPDRNTFFVDVPEELATQWGRKHHADDFTEYLVPSEVVAGKQLYRTGDEGKAALKMLAGTGAASGGLLTAALAADAVKRKQGRGAP